MRGLGTGGRLVAGLAVIGLLGGCQGGASTAPSASPVVVRYTDPVGDQKQGVGPDIVAVTVDQPDAATVRFGVRFAATSPLGVDVAASTTDTLMVFIGTQPDVMAAGKDLFVVGLHGATLQDEVANGTHLSVTRNGKTELRQRVVKVTVDGPTVTLTLTREIIGNPATLNFLLGAAREGPGGQTSGGDMCPEKAGEYTFASG